jgi:hypothetical protein
MGLSISGQGVQFLGVSSYFLLCRSGLNTNPSKKHKFIQSSTEFRNLVSVFKSSISKLVSLGFGVDSDLEISDKESVLRQD